MADPTPSGRRIRTPDQRLRVFVSSTLQELAEERRAAKAAVDRLRLAPVMFELGARPHPPRELYRAYLDQSDVFVGIYWQRYGWVAPGMEISGLEDEYVLAGNKPKLIYVKAPAPAREARLAGLLQRIQEDDQASYKPFEGAEELRELVENDLALLLTEGFETHHGPVPDAEVSTLASSLPVPPTPLVGRERQIAQVCALLQEARLITLLGPGGIGKTRLALAAAERLEATFEDGSVFVSLASVRESASVFDAVAQALGLKPTGSASALAMLGAYLQAKRMLLVLDNFEQVLEAASGLAALLGAAPGLRVLVTSRALLNLSAEHVYVVPPLTLSTTPGEGEAVQLFLQRVRALRPGYQPDEGGLRAITEIVRRLDGLPLAIELAAARSKLLSPQQLLARLERRLELLSDGPRDLPDRQRTLRSTIDWSFRLLTAAEQRLFAQLGAFVGGATLSAIEAICSGDSEVLVALAELVDHSLVQVLPGGEEPRYGMLEMVREYALEALEQDAGEAEAVRERHMRYYLELAEQMGSALKLEQSRALPLLDAEHANLHLAVVWCLKHQRYAAAVRFGWALWLYWWILNLQDSTLPWMEEVLERGELEGPGAVRLRTVTGALYIRRGEAGRARALFEEALEGVRAYSDTADEAMGHLGLGFALLVLKDYAAAKASFVRGRALLITLDDRWGVAFAQAALARVALAEGDAEGAITITAPLARAIRAAGDGNTAAWALHVLGLAERELGRAKLAAEHLGESLELFVMLGNVAGSAHVIGSISSLALSADDAPLAARLAGAAEALAEAVGALPFQPERSIFETSLEAMRAQLGEAFAGFESAGRALSYEEALSCAREALARVRAGALV